MHGHVKVGKAILTNQHYQGGRNSRTLNSNVSKQFLVKKSIDTNVYPYVLKNGNCGASSELVESESAHKATNNNSFSFLH